MSTSVVTNADEMEKVNAQISIWTGSKWLELANQKTVNTINSNVATISSAVEEAQANITTVETNVDSAMTTADNALSNAQTAISNAQTASDTANDATTVANNAISAATTASENASSALSSATSAVSTADTASDTADSALTKAESAISTANSSSDVANTVSEEVTDLKDGSTMTIAEIESGLALKLVKSDLDDYATEDWTSTEISATADELQTQITSVQTTADTNTTNITSLTATVDGISTSVTSLQSDNSTNQTNISSLQETADSFTASIASIESDVSTNTSDISTNTTNITSLTATATSLSSTIAEVKTDLSDNYPTNDDLSSDLENYTTVTDFSSLSQTVDSLSTTVSGKVDTTTYTSKVTELADSIATKVSQDDYDTEITQLSTAIDAKVSSDDYNTEVTLLSNQISAKVSQTDYDSEITQLSTDINLKVSQGDVISQINAEADNILIQSSKLYLDADSIVFGGTAFITEAMISSVNADTITTGIAVGNEMKLDFTNGTINVNDTFEVDSSGNVTANSLTMTGGEISGTDLDINVSTGTVKFQSGTIESTDSTFLIDIDNKLVSSTNTDSDSNVSQATLESGYLSASYYTDSTGLTNTTSIEEGMVTSTQLSGSIVQYYTRLSATTLEFGLNSSTDTNTGESEYLYISVTDEAPALVSTNTLDLSSASDMTLDSDGKITMSVPTDSSINMTVPDDAAIYLTSSGISMAAPDSNVVVSSGGFKVTNAGASFAGGVSVTGDFYASGKLTISGAKNAVVKTTSGWVDVNAYETAEYYFGDLGFANTGSGSKVKIEMDSLFLETINTSVDYHVLLSSYGDGYAWCSERGTDYFIIESSVPNLDISYEVKAKRLGYENNRLISDDYLNEKEVA